MQKKTKNNINNPQSALCYNRPECHPFIKDDEKRYLRDQLGQAPTLSNGRIQRSKTPWRQILTSVPFIALIFCQVSPHLSSPNFCLCFYRGKKENEKRKKKKTPKKNRCLSLHSFISFLRFCFPYIFVPIQQNIYQIYGICMCITCIHTAAATLSALSLYRLSSFSFYVHIFEFHESVDVDLFNEFHQCAFVRVRIKSNHSHSIHQHILHVQIAV